MGIEFDRGSADQPRGHALLYFRSTSDPEDIWVTYLVILPITFDVSKYVPPFLMKQVGELSAKELSAFAFPPAPEHLGSYTTLEEMAAARGDDILFAGTLNPDDVPAAMLSINEAVHEYAEMYGQVPGAVEEGTVEEGTEVGEPEGAGPGVSEVLYGLMSENDKLGELTKLVGRLRFSIEGSDETVVRETEEDISLLAGHLPDNLDIPQLVRAVKSTGSGGAGLAELYLQRCYHLVQEEYVQLGQIEEKIREMEAEA